MNENYVTKNRGCQQMAEAKLKSGSSKEKS